jgi:hypothetical protein
MVGDTYTPNPQHNTLYRKENTTSVKGFSIERPERDIGTTQSI